MMPSVPSRLIRMARSALSAMFFAGFGVGGMFLGILLSGMSFLSGHSQTWRRRMRKCVRASYRLFVWAADATGLFRVAISPGDRQILATAHGCVVASSHPSLIDVIILMALLPDSTSVAKSAARRNFFYSRVVGSAFLVNDDPIGVLSDASKLLAEGVNVIVFPEGTRTPVNAPSHRLKRGAAQIALHASAPILCVSIESDPPVLAKRQPWWDVGDRIIRYEIKLHGTIEPQSLPQNGTARSAAVALTNAIGYRLWPDTFHSN